MRHFFGEFADGSLRPPSCNALRTSASALKFGERSHTLVQICELYSEDVLIILCRIWLFKCYFKCHFYWIDQYLLFWRTNNSSYFSCIFDNQETNDDPAKTTLKSTARTTSTRKTTTPSSKMTTKSTTQSHQPPLLLKRNHL